MCFLQHWQGKGVKGEKELPKLHSLSTPSSLHLKSLCRSVRPSADFANQSTHSVSFRSLSRLIGDFATNPAAFGCDAQGLASLGLSHNKNLILLEKLSQRGKGEAKGARVPYNNCFKIYIFC